MEQNITIKAVIELNPFEWSTKNRNTPKGTVEALPEEWNKSTQTRLK